MKRIALVLGLLLIAFGASAQESRPRIAVLDAVLLDESPAWNTSVQIAITDIILEYIINQGSYTVLDRSNVDQVFNEIAFQVSGLVQDSEVRQAGVYLGADFVCVIRVGRPFEDVYIISAKIINVESGEVIAQTSQNQRGSISVLLDAANLVGSRLTGISLPGTPVASPEPAPVQPSRPVRPSAPERPVRPIQTPVEEDKQEPTIVYVPAPEPEPLQNNFIGIFGGGASADIWDEGTWENYTVEGQSLGLYAKFGFLRYFSLRPHIGTVGDGDTDLFLLSVPVVINFFPNTWFSPFIGVYWGLLDQFSGAGGTLGVDVSLGRKLVLSFDLQFGGYSDDYGSDVFLARGVFGGAWRF